MTPSIEGVCLVRDWRFVELFPMKTVPLSSCKAIGIVVVAMSSRSSKACNECFYHYW